MAACLWALTAQQPLAAARAPSVVSITPGGPDVRDVVTTATGLQFSDVSVGTGPAVKSGDLVLVDVVGRLEDGKVFLDTRELGTPLAFLVGTTNRYVPEGLSQAVEGLQGGSVRLAVIPPSLAFNNAVTFPGGAEVAPGARLYYEVELLRCEQVAIGLACCTEAVFVGNGGVCLKMPSAAAAGAAPTSDTAASS